MEKLLGFLDGPSTLILARDHDLTKKVFQRTPVWNKVVRATCPVGQNRHWDDEADVKTNEDKLRPLLTLLKMAKDPAKMKLTLLDVICEKFPPESEKDRTMVGGKMPQYVKVSFSCPHKDHSVSAMGFADLHQS